MPNEMELTPNAPGAAESPAPVEMPRPTIGPLVLAAGIVLLASGAILGTAYLILGALIFVCGLVLWMTTLLPGRGHMHEELAVADRQTRPVSSPRATVEQLQPGMMGYRAQLPQKVQPVSAGVKGGIVGGIVMFLPALIYTLLSGHGIWYPVNLLAGMLVPGVGAMDTAQLDQFHFGLLIAGLFIHVLSALVLGLIYGMLLPTLPEIPGESAWGGLLVPLIWSGIAFVGLTLFNPMARNGVSWPFFMLSQFVFGVVAATIVHRSRASGRIRAGVIGGAVGGILMILPAAVWGLWSHHGPWYPMNLLAGMVIPGIDRLPAGELDRFHANWFWAATILHAVMSVGIGILYGLFLDKLPGISGALTWGGLLFPLLWTGLSYGLMGVVNPVLHERVDWPWFVISQFIFGATAAYVVGRSELISIPPAGGPALFSGPAANPR